VAREVQHRHAWAQSADITSRLSELRELQEASKAAERRVLSDHDYSHILAYFKKMHDLRRAEAGTREFLVGELEAARGRVAGGVSAAQLGREQLEECERMAMAVADDLNARLSRAESAAQRMVNDHYALAADLHRLIAVVDNFSTTPEGEASIRMCEINKASSSIKELHRKLHLFKELRDDRNRQLREKELIHLEEIEKLSARVRELEDKLRESESMRAVEVEKTKNVSQELLRAAHRTGREAFLLRSSAREGWASSVRFASKAASLQGAINQLKPLLLAGVGHSHGAVFEICFTLLHLLPGVASEEEHGAVRERLGMDKEEKLTIAVRQYELAREKARLASASSRIRTPAISMQKNAGSVKEKKQNSGVPSNSSSSKELPEKKTSRNGTPTKKSNSSNTPKESSKKKSKK
jgi:hypothetical protein